MQQQQVDQEPVFQGEPTEVELAVLEFVERAALQERRLEGVEEIAHALGFKGSGTIRGIMLRLERKGYVKIESYQRGQRVYAVRLDKWTLPPMCLVPHYSTIYEKSKRDTPTQPVSNLLQFPSVLAEVNRLQRERGVTFSDAQVMLMSLGVQMMAIERCRSEAHG